MEFESVMIHPSVARFRFKSLHSQISMMTPSTDTMEAFMNLASMDLHDVMSAIDQRFFLSAVPFE